MQKHVLRLSTCLLAVMMIMAAACAAEDEQQPDWQVFASQINGLIPRLLGRYRVPGAAVAIVHRGEPVWLRGYGLADKNTGLPVVADTVFQAGSISKTITALGVMRLVETGKLDLDAPAERYLSRWHLPPSVYDHSQVSIRRILSHSAGLSVHGYGGNHPDGTMPSLIESLSGYPNGPGELRVVAPPGKGFRYSGGGYTLLQLIVEEVTGEPFAEYMQRTVLNPLGMHRSSFRWTDRLRALTATGFNTEEIPLPNYLFTEKAAAGLYTTAEDLARFVAANMSGPKGEPAGRGVISTDNLKLMFTPIIAMPLFPNWDFRSDVGYGLGYIKEKLPEGLTALEHQGSNRGWRACFIFVPAKQAGLVILTNSDNGFYVINDLLCVWGAWLGIGPPALCRVSTELRQAVLTASFLLIAMMLGWLAWLAVSFSKGHRIWRSPFSFTSYQKRWLRVAFRAVASGLLIVSWFGLLKPMLNGFVPPETTCWSTVAVSSWGVAIFIGFFLDLCPPRKGAS